MSEISRHRIRYPFSLLPTQERAIVDGGRDYLVVRFKYDNLLEIHGNSLEVYDECSDMMKELIRFLRGKGFSVDAELSEIQSGGIYIWFNGYSIG